MVTIHNTKYYTFIIIIINIFIVINIYIVINTTVKLGVHRSITVSL